MTNDRIAVIDLGSNTFHLLICDILEDNSWAVIHKERIYVKLASAGLEEIDAASEERGMDAMGRFAEQIKAFGVLHVKAIGTAALREARNGRTVADRLASASGLHIEIIDGQKEAGYILRGIKSCLPKLEQYGLIMDIGGGSVEFILFKKEHIVFKGSYKIGVAVLFRKFHHSDPISTPEIKEMENFLGEELEELISVVKSIPGFSLIGASGSFEVLNDVLPRLISSNYWSELGMSWLNEYLDEIIQTDMNSRRSLPEIPIERLDYIVVAYILIRFIVRQIPPQKLFYSDFALKEGVLDEMIEERNFRLV